MLAHISKIMVSLFGLILICAGCSGGGTTPVNGGGGRTLTGQVAVSSSDLHAAGFHADQIARAKAAVLRFATSADSALPDAAVTLYQVNADGTKSLVSGVTATTDASGNYTLTNVPDAITGTGAATDFYYEIDAKSGTLEVSAPAAPTTDAVVNVSPETTIAAAMLSDVASVPSVTAAAVLPSENVIDLLREIVYANINDMSTFTLPSLRFRQCELKAMQSREFSPELAFCRAVE